MLDYDREAARYDETRGGAERAGAAAEGITAVLPTDIRTVVDIAGGTGLVAQGLTGPGRTVMVVDASAGMLGLAAGRHPGRVMRADARRLPIRTGSLDAATTIWLLHLLAGPDDVAAVIGEIARILRPGGVYVTTVNKNSAHRHREPRPDELDARDTVLAVAARHGLRPAGSARFVGVGQGSPGVGDGSDPVFRLAALRRT